MAPAGYTGKFVIRGTFPLKTGCVKSISTPQTIGKSEVEYKVAIGQLIDGCSSLRDIAAKVIVTNDDYNAVCEDFAYLSKLEIITVS